MAYVFDFATQRIRITAPQTVVTIQDLLNEIRLVEASQLGISYRKIADASGKQTLGPGVQVGITVTLLENWQLEFWAGNYTATINGGNIVADSGDAVAFVPGGPQVEITLSAAATIASGGGGGGGGLTAEQATQLAELWRIHGLQAGLPLTVSNAQRAAGSIVQTISDDGTTTTVSRT